MRATITARIQGNQDSSIDLGERQFPFELEYSKDLVNGVLANQFDLLFTDTRTLIASATENLDLNAVLTDAFGAVVNALEIVGIMVTAAPGNTNAVVVGGAASNGFVGAFGAAAHTINVPAGGVFLIFGPNAAGLGPVVAATGDILKIANSGAGTPVTYSIAILARSA